MDEEAEKMKDGNQQGALEEAQAEEAFVNDAEDKVFNPLVESANAQAEEESIIADADVEIPGAVGSGKLETVLPDNPVNNEEALKSESAKAEEKITVRIGEKMKPNEEVAPTEQATAPASAKPASEPVEENVLSNATDAMKPAKKKKTGLIVGIILALLLLIGAGIGGVMYFNWHESKDKVATDAFSKLLSVKLEDGKYVSVGDGVGVSSIAGSAVFTNKDVDEYDEDEANLELEKVTLTLNTESEAVKGSAELKVAIATNNDEEFSFVADAKYVGDAKLFVKLSDLSEIKSKIVNLIAEQSDEADNTAMVKFYEDVIGAVTTAIDGQWAEISDDTLSELLGDNYNNEFSCVMKAYENTSASNKDEIMKAYQDNAFLSLGDVAKDVEGAKSGLTYYEVKIDKESSKKFAEAIEELDAGEELEKCFESSAIEEEVESEISNNELESTTAIEDDDYYDDEDELATTGDEDEIDAKVYVGIKTWSHEIQNVIVASDTDEANLSGNFDLAYGSVTISAPEDAKSLKEYASTAFDGAKKAIKDNEDAYVAQKCDSYKDYKDYYVSCVASAKEEVSELSEMEFDDFLDAMLGGISETDTATVDIKE